MPAPFSAHSIATSSRADGTVMQGIRIFASLDEARRQGFTIFEKVEDGYIVRRDEGGKFALALVRIDRDTVARPAS